MYYWNKQRTVVIKFVKTFSTSDDNAINGEEKDQESLASVIIPKKKPNPYKDNLAGYSIKSFVCNLKAPWARNRYN